MPAFYRDFLNKPQALNHFQTMNRYWMEDSFGKYGVQLDAFGPYQHAGQLVPVLPDRLSGGSATRALPAHAAHDPCNLNFRTDARAAWLADVGAAKVAEYDNIFYVSAGEDESSTWQEFGEMKFKTQDDVTDAFGPQGLRRSDADQLGVRPATCRGPRGRRRSTIWPNASGNTSIEAESSGMATYAHELTHNLGLPDNYNNPFGTTQQRAGHRHVGHDEPRLVQRPGRPAHPLPDPADAGRLARLAAQRAQQARPELPHRRRPAAPQPRRPRSLGHGRRGRHRA